MGQVVLSLKKESEEKLRKLAHITKGGRKGALSETVEEALDIMEKGIRQKKALEKLVEIANEGRHWGVGKFRREEAYE